MAGSITLTGFIYPSEDGMLISHCNELDIDTCADSFEEIQQRTEEMIHAYFVASTKMGMYNELMERLQALSMEASQRTWQQGQWRAVPKDLIKLKFDTEFRELRA